MAINLRVSTVQPIEKSELRVQNFFPDVHVANAFIILHKYCRDTQLKYTFKPLNVGAESISRELNRFTFVQTKIECHAVP